MVTEAKVNYLTPVSLGAWKETQLLYFYISSSPPPQKWLTFPQSIKFCFYFFFSSHVDVGTGMETNASVDLWEKD